MTKTNQHREGNQGRTGEDTAGQGRGGEGRTEEGMEGRAENSQSLLEPK